MKNLFLFLTLSLLAFSSCEVSDDFSPSQDGSNFALNSGTTLHTVSVDQFTWVSGNSAFASASRDRLYSSTFIFRSGGDFTYTFNFDGFKYNLYGEYFEDGNNKYVFYAVKNTNNGAGSGTQIIVQGSIEPASNGKYRIKMEYGSSANYSATVNNQQFFNQASKRFTTTMTAER